MDGAGSHISVLGRETVASLRPESGGIYVDGTLGLGGHARLVLEASGPAGRLLGLEWDEQALALAAERLAVFGDRVLLRQASYAELADVLGAEEIEKVNGIVLDLGVSSLQLDLAERGFSFQADGPLDMRMDGRLPGTAADLVARLSQEELADIFFHYGEERQARRIAAHIVAARAKEEIATTARLAALVAEAVPRKYHPEKIHVATRVFQALRIAVNRELDNLARVLAEAPGFLAKGGRMCVITFHSLEDRMVKHVFATNARYRVVNRKPIVASAEEVAANPRSRSAKLRVAEKV